MNIKIEVTKNRTGYVLTYKTKGVQVIQAIGTADKERVFDRCAHFAREIVWRMRSKEPKMPELFKKMNGEIILSDEPDAVKAWDLLNSELYEFTVVSEWGRITLGNVPKIS